VPASTETPTAELVSRAAEQASRLMRDELQLAKAELAGKGKHAGIGAGMLGAAGLFGLFGLAVLTACAILALNLVLPAWLSALIIGAAYMAVAGIAALAGKNQVQQAVPPPPAATLARVKEDIRAVKEHLRHGTAG
jgi:hypothetical protein